MDISCKLIADLFNQITIVGHMVPIRITAWITRHCARVQLVADVRAKCASLKFCYVKTCLKFAKKSLQTKKTYSIISYRIAKAVVCLQCTFQSCSAFRSCFSSPPNLSMRISLSWEPNPRLIKSIAWRSLSTAPDYILLLKLVSPPLSLRSASIPSSVRCLQER